jgi:hypothetical protein
MPTGERARMPTPEAAQSLVDDLVVGSRILFQQKIVDGFGHISARLEAARLGPITFIDREEAALYEEVARGAMHRPWDMWRDELEDTGL